MDTRSTTGALVRVVLIEHGRRAIVGRSLVIMTCIACTGVGLVMMGFDAVILRVACDDHLVPSSPDK